MNKATAANIAQQARKKEASRQRAKQQRAMQRDCEHPNYIPIEGNLYICDECGAYPVKGIDF